MRNNHRIITILISILLLSLNLRASQQDGSVLNRKVSLNAENLPLNNILDQISWQTRVYFSYDASQVDGAETHSIQVIEKSLYSVLRQLFNSEEFQFTERENQIIIYRKGMDNSALARGVNDSIPPKYFFLSGQIIDDRREDPIAYASVSLYGKPIGTISNVDGDFLLKLHPDNIRDSLVISCLGYEQVVLPADSLLDLEFIRMNSVSVQIKEVKVTSTTPEKLLTNIRENLRYNYTQQTKLMSAFYRETVQQDDSYINVSEAVIEVLKSPYDNSYQNDVVRLIKGRQSPDVQPLTWINFKLQGGPYTITKLDVVKTVESFIDEDFQAFYKYKIKDVIRYRGYPVYVLEFKPAYYTIYPVYVGELYVHRETFAIIHASFGLDRKGLKEAADVLIRRKPSGVKADPSAVNYEADYQLYQGKWHLQTARASIAIKIRSRKDGLNSEFHSTSDLLVTNIVNTDVKRFNRQETFSQRDIFVEMISDYDPAFWENYNIIQPDEDLRNAIQNLSLSD